METKLNIAEILKDKPVGTKLYSPLFGDVYLLGAECDVIRIKHHRGSGDIAIFFGDGRYYNYPESEPLLFPSKEMCDWSKFAWKKGDVLVSKGRRTLHVIFEGFNDDTYTTFKGKHYICDYLNKENQDDEEYYNDYHKEVNERTIEFEKDNVNNAQTYINIIEKRLGGKLNRETLEIEKTQPEFKDGDILCVIDSSDDYHYILIYKGQDDKHIYRYVTMFEDNSLHIRKDAHLTKPKDYSMRYATDKEKQQLFDALAKEGKAWDAEKKQIVNLKPKVELKPFDKVLVRDNKLEYWRANLFSHIDKYGCHYCVWSCWNYCIPYEGNEHLLGTTNDPK
jgi:hypothetical protein